MKILITGAGGMLGHDVTRVAEGMSHQVIALTHDDLDVTDPAKVERLITRERPGAVINCAAWTNVDGAEESEHDASLVNAQGAGFVADAAAKVDAKLIYPSTDYVFDGTTGPYGESDDPDPINAYGATKLGGERATALVNRRSFIVRTSWLFGPHGGNFVETMLRLGQDGGPVVVVHDQVGCPTYTGHLAVGLLRLVESSAYGIHHMAGEGRCSWYEFALEIFRQAEVVTRVMATTTDMMERPAKRPGQLRPRQPPLGADRASSLAARALRLPGAPRPRLPRGDPAEATLERPEAAAHARLDQAGARGERGGR